MTTEQQQELFPTNEAAPEDSDVYTANLKEELELLGSLPMPTPLPTELEVIISGWHYVYKLDRRYPYNGISDGEPTS